MRWKSLPVRGRQEVQKVIGRLTAALDPGATLLRRGVRPQQLAHATMARDTPGLRTQVRVGAGDRPPDMHAIIDSAQATLNGQWTLLGAHVQVDPGGMQWEVHPLTGVRARSAHWSQCRVGPDEFGADVKYLWELNRHGQLLRLSQGWLLTGQETYIDTLGVLLDSWMRQHKPGWGINWTSALEVGLRAVAWCWLRAMTDGSPLWTPEREATFKWFLWHHGRFLERYDSRHHSPNTHLTGEALALLCIGSHYPDFPRADRWRATGVELLEQHLDLQIAADGFHYERSVGYHRYSMEFALLGAMLLDARDSARDRLLQIVVRASDALVALDLDSHGTWAALSDDDGGVTLPLHTRCVPDPAETLDAVAALTGRTDLVRSGGTSRTWAWWLGLGNPVADAAPVPLRPTRAIGGFALGRGIVTNGIPVACLVSVGPHAGRSSGHAHSDIGHLQLHWGGRPLVVDPGSPAYSGDLALRSWSRSEYGHGCVSLGAFPQAVAAGPFRWRTVCIASAHEIQDEADAWLCRLTRRLEAPGATGTQVRLVALLKGIGVLVVDQIDGAPGHGATVTWPFCEPVVVFERGDQTILESSGVHLISVASGTGAVRWLVTPKPMAHFLGAIYEGQLAWAALTTGSPTTLASLFVSAGTLFTPVIARDQVGVEDGHGNVLVTISLKSGLALKEVLAGVQRTALLEA